MIHFKHFTEEENSLINEFLEEAIPYFETINKKELFNNFFNLLNEIKIKQDDINNIEVVLKDDVNVSNNTKNL